MLGTQRHCPGGDKGTEVLLWRRWGHRGTALDVMGTQRYCSGGGGTHRRCSGGDKDTRLCPKVLGSGVPGGMHGQGCTAGWRAPFVALFLSLFSLSIHLSIPSLLGVSPLSPSHPSLSHRHLPDPLPIPQGDPPTPQGPHHVSAVSVPQGRDAQLLAPPAW